MAEVDVDLEPVRKYLADYDPPPATIEDTIVCEMRGLRTKAEEIPGVMMDMMQKGSIARDPGLGNDRQLTAHLRMLAEQVQSTLGNGTDTDHETNGEVSNGHIEVGQVFPASITEVAVGRFCHARFGANGRTFKVHIPWENTNGVPVRKAGEVTVRINRLPDRGNGQPSYGGELME